MREQLERKISSSTASTTPSLSQGSSVASLNSSAFNSSVKNESSAGVSNGALVAPSNPYGGADSTTNVPKYSLTREKNREAAQRCREKRKKWIATIQNENKQLQVRMSEFDGFLGLEIYFEVLLLRCIPFFLRCRPFGKLRISQELSVRF